MSETIINKDDITNVLNFRVIKDLKDLVIDGKESIRIKIDGKEHDVVNNFKINVFLDELCNADCPFCINHLKKEILKNPPLSYEDFVKRFDDLYEQLITQLPLKPFIMFTGGEPTISKWFIPFIDHLLQKNIRFNLLTNGTYLLAKHKGKSILEYMTPNCGGMHLSRAHYDDKINQEIMRLKIPYTNEQLNKAVKYMNENFKQPFTIGISCMMLQDGVKDVNDIAKYVDAYRESGLHCYIFRQMENYSIITDTNTKWINEHIVNYKDIVAGLEAHPDFKHTNTINYEQYLNHFWEYKGCNLLFCEPPPITEVIHSQSTILDSITLNPDGNIFVNYLEKV